ncbi:hypothetical protein RHMOL_Rhmol09G0090800 [Rhododendron molle]|uniref:Uncharacterized protein n=1 Tax=Rhododendron molle TaxID=49168 RepID=A0ACC0MBS0_RHOML|nr:hypothetical protein RHMOL_Rhmol09G0090800 [Rhododendron molle]
MGKASNGSQGTFSTQVRRPSGGDSFEGFTSWKSERLQFKSETLGDCNTCKAAALADDQKQQLEVVAMDWQLTQTVSGCEVTSMALAVIEAVNRAMTEIGGWWLLLRLVKKTDGVLMAVTGT